MERAFKENSPRTMENTPRTLMVVEDDPAVREGLQLLFKGKYEVLAFADGDEMAGLVETYRPNVILLDINLPGRDGYALCRQVRNSSAIRHIPIIFITARRDDESFVRSIQVDGDAYLTKPFEPRELMETVERLTH